MSKLLQQYEDEMILGNYCQQTITCYKGLVRLFIMHFYRHPLKITDLEIKKYLRTSSSQALLRQRLGAIKLFYKLVLNDDRTFEYIRYPRRYLFNGQQREQYSVTSIQQFIKKYAAIAQIKKRVHPHLLRHCTATHLLESGTELAIIQKLLGHKNIKTTMRYTHISNRTISKIRTPDLELA